MVSTVLLPAADWNLSTNELVWAASSNHFFPSLSALTNSLISKLLDAPHDSHLQSTMAMHLLYLYGHVKSLKVQSFIDSISPENRQFHIDAVSGQPVGTLPMIAHEREVRAQVRREENERQGTST
ncbi:hypothetical protein CkaCkLH20_04568 [Colletotrichum karsti]|uniref:Uncharacterized protein n=1 Tax=Colletotrichum karsti TaxID=1095194 RepID=A0A9P6I6V4_9PEZI|nr:uncharacterized protein CkaCkLH20_04568 [Colletotrichum karsti]KAF9877992.1 hypothetical protein CkaCkLH20_04568 [Colletotrichum karsti]